jgi:hypothetical protein
MVSGNPGPKVLFFDTWWYLYLLSMDIHFLKRSCIHSNVKFCTHPNCLDSKFTERVYRIAKPRIVSTWSLVHASANLSSESYNHNDTEHTWTYKPVERRLKHHSPEIEGKRPMKTHASFIYFSNNVLKWAAGYLSSFLNPLNLQTHKRKIQLGGCCCSDVVPISLGLIWLWLGIR